MKIILQPMEEQTVAARGETVVYLNGSEPLLITASGKRAEIPSTSQVRFDVFNEVKFQNKGLIAAEFEIFIVEGEFRSLAEGSKVITDIANTSDINTPIVMALRETLDIRTITETLKAQITNEVNIRKISETLKTQITNEVNIRKINEILSIEEEPASSLVTSKKTFSAGESFTISANESRRDLSVFTDEVNVGLVIVAGRPLEAGKVMEFKNYIGTVSTQADTANDKIYITEVIK